MNLSNEEAHKKKINEIKVSLMSIDENKNILDMSDREFFTYIYDKYYIEKHMSSLKISEIIKIKPSYISKYFNKYGLNMRDNTEKGKLYHCNKNYFEKIDSEDKAYWLGFLYADGYIQSKGKENSRKLGLSLSIKDISHLEKFKKCLEYDGEIHIYKTGKSAYKEGLEYCRILITEEKLVEDLCDKGCVEHKTNILTFPTYEQVPKNLMNHFIRGYFDGDGSIYTSTIKGKERVNYNISFTGTKNFLLGVMNELYINNAILRLYPLYKRKPQHTVENFRFGGSNNVKNFCDYIYKNATIYLERKHSKYEELLKLIEEVQNRLIVHKCDVCGDTESLEYDRWLHDDKYYGMTLCSRHYRQLLRSGEITKINKDSKKQNKCVICGDDREGIYHIYHGDNQYDGKELCRKHYDQLRRYGYIKDETPVIHKEAA